MIGEFVPLTPEKNPAVFSEKSDQRVSPKYCHINTWQPLEALRKLGWENFQSKQVNRNARSLRIGKTNDTSKHMLRLRNVNDVKATTSVEGCGEITIINSHDRTSGWLIAAGWLEFICSNGLISMREGSYFKMRHVGITTEKIVEVVTKLAQQFPQMSEERERYLSIPIAEVDATQFAKEAASLRFNTEYQLNYSDLLVSRYQQQSDMNLWNVFNNVQRNLFAGGFQTTRMIGEKYQTRKVKKINAIDANVRINGQLWSLLELWSQRLSNENNQ